MNEALAREESRYLSSTLWFLAGGVAGAGIGLLLAPQSGRDTRQMMARRVRGGADSARELRARVVGRGEEMWEEAAQRVGDAASALSGSAERKPAKRNEAPPA
jgi:gas vesicle protein